MESIIYVAPDDMDSALIRWLLFEKEAPIKVTYVPKQGPYLFGKPPPFYLDGDVIIYEHYALVQFLQERFPSEQLMPLDPIPKAQMRQVCREIREADAIDILPQIESVLRSGHPYMTGSKFTIVDLYAGARLEYSDLEAYPEAQKFLSRLYTRPGVIEQVLS